MGKLGVLAILAGLISLIGVALLQLLGHDNVQIDVVEGREEHRPVRDEVQVDTADIKSAETTPSTISASKPLLQKPTTHIPQEPTTRTSSSTVSVSTTAAPPTSSQAVSVTTTIEVPYAPCPTAKQTGCAGLNGKRAFAIFIVGLRERLLFNSTLEHVVGSIAKQGFAVHLYFSLVDRRNSSHFLRVRSAGHEDASLHNLNHWELRRRFYQRIRAVGACLICMALSSAPESLPEIPRNKIWDDRLFQYPPHKDPLGKNVLRVWKSREALWRAATNVEQELRMRYSIAMWTRDDAWWFGRLVSPQDLLRNYARANETVWSKDCKTWTGINDKTVLLGRDAAEAMFSAYSSYWRSWPAFKSINAEVYLKQLAMSKKLNLQKLPFSMIPSSDAMIYGDNQVCVIKKYWCPHASEWNHKLCEETVWKRTRPQPKPGR